MIFPKACKEVGFFDETADSKEYMSVNDKSSIYFSTKYLIKKTDSGFCIYKIFQDEKSDSKANENGGIKNSRINLIRKISSEELIASENETVFYEKAVRIQNRTDLILKAAKICSEKSKRAVIFEGYDSHMIFIADPSTDALLNIHVYDSIPPYPNLVRTIENLEAAGIFGDLEVIFTPHIQDITEINADVYPCRAGGFKDTVKTLDKDKLSGGEKIAGCLTAHQFLEERCPDKEFEIINICPFDRAVKEKLSPYIARCCRTERCGIKNSKSGDNQIGAVVHWGSNPKDIADAVFDAARLYRSQSNI